MRVPTDPAGRGTQHIELKTSATSANPYLALGAVLTAGLDGVQRRLSPPEPVDIDPERWPRTSGPRRHIDALPTSLGPALEHLEHDTLLREALGPDLARATSWPCAGPSGKPWTVPASMMRCSSCWRATDGPVAAPDHRSARSHVLTPEAASGLPLAAVFTEAQDQELINAHAPQTLCFRRSLRHLAELLDWATEKAAISVRRDASAWRR